MTDFSNKTAFVTGATSGLGFEASAQLAEMGYGSVTITARTQEKANDAVQALVERTGRDVFDTVVVDVASIESSRKAAADLIGRDRSYDVVLLNAGMVPNELQRTADGLEMCFAASLVGHHILATELLDAGLIEGASVVLVGSEAANNDLPKAMGMSVYDFVLGESTAFGASPAEAMTNFAKAESGPGIQRPAAVRLDEGVLRLVVGSDGAPPWWFDSILHGLPRGEHGNRRRAKRDRTLQDHGRRDGPRRTFHRDGPAGRAGREALSRRRTRHRRPVRERPHVHVTTKEDDRPDRGGRCCTPDRRDPPGHRTRGPRHPDWLTSGHAVS